MQICIYCLALTDNSNPSRPTLDLQKGDGKKEVSDQWLPPFVIVDEQDKPVGTIEVRFLRSLLSLLLNRVQLHF